MANIQAKDLRRGTAIFYEGVPYRVLEFEHRTPGNLRAFVQAKLRNLLTGTQRDVRFSSTETVERASMETREMDFLYRDNAGYVFMDIESYEQITVADDVLGERALWLADGMRINVEVLEGNPIGIQLPKTIEAIVKETEAVIKGQTAARSAKPATLHNGLRVNVPPFIAVGDRIRVDPEELTYIDRVK
jgi:elongation factor P